LKRLRICKSLVSSSKSMSRVCTYEANHLEI
jgi:hypothetical protein